MKRIYTIRNGRFFLVFCFLLLISNVAKNAHASPSIFNPAIAYPVAHWSESVAIGDVNGDGRNDIVLVTSIAYPNVEDERDYIYIFLQDIFGLLSPIRVKSTSELASRLETVTIGDFNSDGVDDIAVGYFSDLIELYSVTGNNDVVQLASFSSEYSYVIKSADVDGDGRDDLVGIGWGGDDVAVYLNDLYTGISPAYMNTYYAPHGGYDDLALGDISQDGLIDIVVMSGQSFLDNLAVLTQQGEGVFNAPEFFDLGGRILTNGVTITDANSDGLNDIVASYGGNRPSSNIAVYYQDAYDGFSSPLSLPSYDIPEPIESADLNLDGKEDLAVLHGGWVALGVYLQQQNGTLAEERRYTIPYASHYAPQGLALGDINNDGKPDAVIADYNHGLVVLTNAVVPPNVEAGDDIRVKRSHSKSISLNGSAWDSDGTVVKVSWKQVSGVAVELLGEDTLTPVFKAPLVKGEKEIVLKFELSAEDNIGAVSTDRVSVAIHK